MSEIEVEINFTDITLNETEGDFEQTKDLMESEPPYSNRWAIITDVTISAGVGVCSMNLQLQNDKSIYILRYSPSIGDVFYNLDLQILYEWSQMKGWNRPQPHPRLVKENKEFWKHFFDTYIIDSDYMEEIYGKRT